MTKPSDRIRELAEAGESHPFLLGNGAKIDAVIAYLDEQAEVPPGNAPTALAKLREVKGSTGANAKPSREYPLYSQLCEQRDTLTAQLDEARAALARVEASTQVEGMTTGDWYRRASKLGDELAKVTAERDSYLSELRLMYEAFRPQNIANPREARQHIEGLRQDGKDEALTQLAKELCDMTAERDTLTARVELAERINRTRSEEGSMALAEAERTPW